MAGDAAWCRELAEEPVHAVGVLPNLWKDLRVGALEIHIGDQRRSAVPRARQVDDLRVALPNQAIKMHVNEAQSRRGAPVAEQPRLDVLGPQWLAQQWVAL